MTSNGFRLADLNDLLARASLPSLTRTQAQSLVALEPREHIIDAARRATSDQNSRAWLYALFQRRRLIGEGEGASNAPPDIPVSAAPATFAPPAGSSARQSPSSPVAPPARRGEARSSAPVDSGATVPSANARQRRSWHVYAGKAALSFELSQTRRGDPTVMLDAAAASGTRCYAWQEKITLQLSLRELPIVACVLLGMVRFCEFSGHGDANTKGFSIEYQPQPHKSDHFFIRVWSKGESPRAVPMDAADAYYVSGLVLRQLAAFDPQLSPAARNMLLRRVAAMHQGASPPRQ